MQTIPTRRSVIAIGAGAALLAALGYRAYDRGAFAGATGPAYVQWDEWQGKDGDGILRPLHAAILASNAHDAQPWLFSPTEEGITLYADRGRSLGNADPFRREMYLSLGCALANLQIAASHFGFGVSIRMAHGRLEPSRATAPLEVATILLRPGEAAPNDIDTLYDAIPLRHTHRGPYLRDRKLPAAAMRALFGRYSENVQIVPVTDKVGREEISSIIMDATERFIADAQMSNDSGRWYRTGWQEVQKYRDGICLDAAGLTPTMTVLGKMLPNQSVATANTYWREKTRDVQIPTAALFGIVLVRDRMDIGQTLSAGHAWQVCQLMATRLGLAAQPLNQPVELADRNLVLGRQDFFKPALAALTDWKDWDPTFVFRLGYAERPAVRTPRRPLSDTLRLSRFA